MQQKNKNSSEIQRENLDENTWNGEKGRGLEGHCKVIKVILHFLKEYIYSKYGKKYQELAK